MPDSSFARPDLVLLALGVVSALLAWNVHRPFRPTVSIGTVSFFIGWLTGELAMHHVVVQVAQLTYFGYEGAFASVYGIGGGMLTVGAMGALLRYHEAGHRTADTSASAFVSAGIPAPESRVQSLAVIRPFHMKRRDVVVDRGIEVARVGDAVLHADVFHRSDKPSNAPIVVYVHGGGWVIGYRKYQGLPILNELAQRGFVCVSASYRLSPSATFPDHAHDVFRAVAWAKENASRYGGDPSRVVVVGNSAGGHLAAVAALGHRESRLLPPELATADLATIACVSLYGVFDVTNRHGHWPGLGVQQFMQNVVLKASIEKDPDLYRLASPIDLISRDAPPFLVIHGSRDTLVPVNESRRFVDALREGSDAGAVYLEVDGAQHAFDIFHSIRGRHAVNAIVTFLEATTTHAASGRSAETRMESPACAAS